jgi:hypothetical protein
MPPLFCASVGPAQSMLISAADASHLSIMTFLPTTLSRS